MSKDRRRDRKRQKKLAQKLAEKKRKADLAESLAYMGSKYQTEKLAPTWMHTEVGIYETYIMTDRKLLDETVFSSIETLIRKMRAGTLPPLPDTDETHYEVGGEEDLLIENIRRSWANRFTTESKPSKDKLIGVLRSILGSIKKVKSPSPRSQSYLQHIAGFLTKKLGVSVKAFSADRKPLPEPEEDVLVRLGRQWNVDGNREAKAAFLELVSDLRKSGQAGRVIDACHLLVGEISDPSSEVVAELTGLIGSARLSLVTEMG
ncbi:MAG: hypothetical protein H8E44_20675 [Planctomycetes bacterium]|nr:hypothetical protein [Planctomycetota bacterium]MBL7039672.1 hypothetical protein [Pirellulaceae bacterium]